MTIKVAKTYKHLNFFKAGGSLPVDNNLNFIEANLKPSVETINPKKFVSWI